MQTSKQSFFSYAVLYKANVLHRYNIAIHKLCHSWQIVLKAMNTPQKIYPTDFLIHRHLDIPMDFFIRYRDSVLF